jgi:hypothetical protein
MITSHLWLRHHMHVDPRDAPPNATEYSDARHAQINWKQALRLMYAANAARK